MPISKREKMVRRLDCVGINRLLTLAARRPGLLSLAYHRIGVSANQPFDDALFSATADEFRAQLIYLRDHFDVLSGDTLLQAIQGGKLALKNPSALITFDDGYRDNFQIAFPILRELRVPAVFFIAVRFVDEPLLTWWDHVAYVVKTTGQTVLNLDYPVSEKIDLREIGPSQAIRRILRIYKQTHEIDQRRFLDQLALEAKVNVDSAALGRELFMSWDQIREMSQAGMEIGGHTFSHPILSQISEEAQRQELSRSKERLESETKKECRFMAYPVGGPSAFDSATKRLAQEAGYRAAFSFFGGFNRPSHADLFDIRRVGVESSDSLPMFRFRASMSNLCGSSVL
jgi:peptidoglycan/xylan/chitin deacetylase (PgdA/CDA1 family)